MLVFLFYYFLYEVYVIILYFLGFYFFVFVWNMGRIFVMFCNVCVEFCCYSDGCFLLSWRGKVFDSFFVFLGVNCVCC